MLIYYLSRSILPSEIANSVQVVEMCDAFRRKENDVVLYGKDGTDSDSVDESISEFYGVSDDIGIKTKKAPNIRRIGNLVFASRVANDLRSRHPPDLLYARDPYSLFLSFNEDTPQVFEAHEPPHNPVRKQTERQIFRRNGFRKLVTISNALKRKYITEYDCLSKEDIVVAHDAAKKDLLNSGATIVELDQTFDSDQFHVGYVGSLYPGKGGKIIVSLASHLPDVQFHIVGGTSDDLPFRSERTDRNNIHFHGYVPHSAVGEYLKEFDIVLAPYQRKVSLKNRDGDISRWMSPLKLFEYMAASKPIVASDLPVIREILTDQETALLVEPESVEEWIQSINRLRDDSLRETLGTNARSYFIENHTWDARAEKILRKI